MPYAVALRDSNGYVYECACQWGCALKATIRVTKCMMENAAAPTRHGYRAECWKSNPGMSRTRVA
jgi:hypothetical protein